jgi:hypothetical protein
MSFFVKNVENVQGDERDVIVFSTTFGRDESGAFRRTFGVLGQRGGERRLNVAITRARDKVILVTSMPVGEISDMMATGRQPAIARDYLQSYMDYAWKVSDGDPQVGYQPGRAFRVCSILFAQLASYRSNNIERAIKRESAKVLRPQHRLQLRIDLLTQCLEASIGNVYGTIVRNLDLPCDHFKKIRLQWIQTGISHCMVDVVEIANGDVAPSQRSSNFSAIASIREIQANGTDWTISRPRIGSRRRVCASATMVVVTGGSRRPTSILIVSRFVPRSESYATVATYCLEPLVPETASTIVNGRSFAGRLVTAALKAFAARLRAERADSVGMEIEKSKSSLSR